MLFQCWPTVFDAGPTLKQRWLNASCLLAIAIVIIYFNPYTAEIFLYKPWRPFTYLSVCYGSTAIIHLLFFSAGST